MNVFDEVKKRIEPEAVLRKFGVSYSVEGTQFLFSCPTPGHADANPSCFMSRAMPGVWACKSCGAKGSTVDLWKHLSGKSEGEIVEELAEEAGIDAADYNSAAFDDRPSELVAKYDYRDKAGRHVYSVERWEPGVPRAGQKRKSKSFSWRLPDGSSRSPPKGDLTLFGLGDVLTAGPGDTIFLVEGEKTRNAVSKIGCRAVTWPSGGPAWAKVPEEVWSMLADLDVVCLPDNDGAGAKAMQDLAKHLGAMGVSVRRGLLLGLPPKGDADDWVTAGGTKAELMQVAALAMPFDTGEWREGLRRNARNELTGSMSNVALILENAAGCHGVIRKNKMGEIIEVCKAPPWRCNPATYPRPFTDDDIFAIVVWLATREDDEIAVASAVVFEAVKLVAHLNECDLLADYLNGLKWDGVERIATFARDFLNVEDEQEVDLANTLAEMWLVSAAKRGLEPGAKVDTVMVLEGAQGVQKSTALMVLGGEWATDQVKDIESKDTQMLISQTWICEIAELDAFSKKETNAIKNWASAPVEKYRPPYGKTLVECPRRCVVAGTTNANVYLRDATGDRRFWPVKVGSRLDLDKLRAARDQIWAECVVRVKDGFRYWIDIGSPLDERLLAYQASRVEQDPWHDTVASYCHGLREVTVAGALGRGGVGLDIGKQTKMHSLRATGIFRTLGYSEVKVSRVDGRPQRVYNKRANSDPGSV